MAKPKLTGYRLVPRAEQDLEDIWIYGAQNWSAERADRYMDELEATFDLLLLSPELARERTEFDPPVRLHPSGSHLIVYRINAIHLDILRVLGGAQNWLAVLRTLDQ
ncbi:type II toxin-antitoxin system RelE/ParE family toxin [Roseibium sediminis]|uniref:type II toxin-antitoxin system RelE/ParE family toxin n=1 Tax=Roseibium sediminis TaxID=1775174 RepID=UPI00123C94C2|nr:type II toxin-antitoxin system RelE/ParE family toxin [Roseibium sediminis]